jgi:hypothetical protein
MELFEEKPARYEIVIDDILKGKLEYDNIIKKIKVGEKIISLGADEMPKVKTIVLQEIYKAKDVARARIKKIC